MNLKTDFPELEAIRQENEPLEDFFQNEMDGNIFVILGHFQQAARKAGWPHKDAKLVVNTIIKNAESYDHALAFMMEFID